MPAAVPLGKSDGKQVPGAPAAELSAEDAEKEAKRLAAMVHPQGGEK
jgi:hypothetical protein